MGIKEEREKIGISQKDFAEILGVTPAAVCQWETGRTFPKGRTAKLLSLIFRSPVEQDDESKPPEKKPNLFESLPGEEWKIIRDFPNYSVSTIGRVRNNKTNKVLSQDLSNKGYLMVYLSNNKTNTRKHCSVHRLVATAFIKNPSNQPVVNHKDEDKTNNVVSNLEWCDQRYNINYGTALSRRCKTLSEKANRTGIHRDQHPICN